MSLKTCPHCHTRSLNYGRFLIQPVGLAGYRQRCPNCHSWLALSWRYRWLELVAIVVLGVTLLKISHIPSFALDQPKSSFLDMLLVFAAFDAIVKSVHFVFGRWRIAEASPSEATNPDLPGGAESRDE